MGRCKRGEGVRWPSRELEFGRNLEMQMVSFGPLAVPVFSENARKASSTGVRVYRMSGQSCLGRYRASGGTGSTVGPCWRLWGMREKGKMVFS